MERGDFPDNRMTNPPVSLDPVSFLEVENPPNVYWGQRNQEIRIAIEGFFCGEGTLPLLLQTEGAATDFFL